MQSGSSAIGGRQKTILSIATPSQGNAAMTGSELSCGWYKADLAGLAGEACTFSPRSDMGKPVSPRGFVVDPDNPDPRSAKMHEDADAYRKENPDYRAAAPCQSGHKAWLRKPDATTAWGDKWKGNMWCPVKLEWIHCFRGVPDGFDKGVQPHQWEPRLLEGERFLFPAPRDTSCSMEGRPEIPDPPFRISEFNPSTTILRTTDSGESLTNVPSSLQLIPTGLRKEMLDPQLANSVSARSRHEELAWAFSYFLPPSHGGRQHCIMPDDVRDIWHELQPFQRSAWKIRMWHTHKGKRGGSCFADETLCSALLHKLGLANVDIVVEVRCCGGSFELYRRHKSGFCTGTKFHKLWNVFFLILELHQYILWPEQNLVHLGTQESSFRSQWGGDYKRKEIAYLYNLASLSTAQMCEWMGIGSHESVDYEPQILAYSHKAMQGHWDRWSAPSAGELPSIDDLVSANLHLPYPLAILSREEACAAGFVSTNYEQMLERIKYSNLFDHILPSAVDGQYEDPIKDKTISNYINFVRPARQGPPMKVEELREFDRFPGSGRPSLMLWRHYGQSPQGGGGLRSLPQGIGIR